MSNIVIMVVALAAIGIIIIFVIMMMMQGGSKRSSISSIIWNDFLKTSKNLNKDGKKIGLMVTCDKKIEPIGENVDKLLLPAFEFALDSIERTGMIQHVGVNKSRDSLPPNCHVFVVFKLELDGKLYVIKPTYHYTNITGSLSREALRFRPDVMKLSSDDMKRFSKRDSLVNTFRNEFPGFIAAVARKV